MRSFQLADSGELEERDAVRPVPGPGEVLVHVRTAGVTRTELGWYPMTHTANGEKRRGAIPSHEFSGEVAEIGEGVSGLAQGDEVYGMNDWFMDGALAEYCPTRPEWVAPKPGRASFAEAASLPIGALTAWQGLFDRAKLQAGERVLVHGGAGAVGIFVLQLAHRRGARVITTVSARNAELARELGADEVIDYRDDRFEEKAQGMDVVFDTVGGETLERSWGLLNAGGRMVTIVSENEASSDERIRKAFFIVEPRGDQLRMVAEMVDAGSCGPW